MPGAAAPGHADPAQRPRRNPWRSTAPTNQSTTAPAKAAARTEPEERDGLRDERRGRRGTHRRSEEHVAIKVDAEIGAQTFSLEAGKRAEQADGAVLVRYGDTVLLATAVSGEPREGIDFFPLTIDYEERMYAAGKIPGGFIKRESRPSEAAILAMRLTDRPIRPLFPKGYKQDVQIVLTVLSADQENDPDILGINGASAALSISHIPFLGPVGAVRVGYIDGAFVTNPTITQLDESDLDLVVAGTRDAVMMVEAGAKILPESLMADA